MDSSKTTSSSIVKENYNIKQLLNSEAESKAPVDSVQLDGLAVMKIMKHCRESYPNVASGQLLGLDFKSVLEISTAFPFPKLRDDKRDEVNLSKHTHEMMRNLREVNADANTVGWYTSTYLGDFLTQNLVDTQFSYQKSLGGKCVVIVHDLSRSSMGNACFRAFRLSQNFMEVYQENKFTTESLQQNNLGFSNILEELPISFHNSHIVNAMMHEMQDDSDLLDTTVYTGTSSSFSIADPSHTSFLSPNFNILELNLEPYIEKSLGQLIESVDEHVSEQNNYAYWQRTVARENARIQQHIQQKKAENISREAKGLAPLRVETEEQLSQMSKLPQEPPRLDSLLINAQTSAYCQQLNQFTCPTIAKMYSAKSLQKDAN